MSTILLRGVLTQEEIGRVAAHARHGEDDQRQDEQEQHAL
jgi:hypothetical protein